MSDQDKTRNPAAEPKWRQDFPIERAADNYITRREFTKFLVLASAATFLGNGYFVLERPGGASESFPSVAVASVDDIAVGGVHLFRYPTENDPAILIRLDNDTFVAYLQRCTHLSCPVHYNTKRHRLDCPCHNGAFDVATGQVLEGPPPRPLPRIALRIEGNQIFAEGFHEA